MGFVLVGLVSSNLLMSMGTIGLFMLALLQLDLGQKLRRFLHDPALLGLTALFFLYLLGGLGTQDQAFWLDKVRIKLPFAILPFAFVALPDLSAKTLRNLMAAFVGITALSVLVVLLRYAVQPAEYAQPYIQGMVMPTPLNHIRYSLVVAFGLAVSIWLAKPSEPAPGAVFRVAGRVLPHRWLWFIPAVFLMVFLHILAVRSGLLAAYLVVGYLLIHAMVSRRQYALGLVLLVAALASGWAAQEYFPTLRNRISYARYDLEQYFRGEVNPDLSDAKRIGSIQAGLQLLAENPLTGVGIGNIKPALKTVYQEHFPGLVENNPLPHNQFVLVAACTGLLGLAALLWALAAPFFAPGMLHNTLFISLQLVMLPSMLTEATLETQYGLTIYLFFTLLFLRYWSVSPKTKMAVSNPRSHKPIPASTSPWQKDA